MIRTLGLIAAVSFVLAIVCIASSLAIAGGPFHIDDTLTYHRHHWNVDVQSAPVRHYRIDLIR